MNVEIKPTPGQEARTGWVVGQVTRELLGGRPAQAGGPLFSSFSGAALAAAREAAPHYARGMLYGRIPREWQEELAARGCVALHCDERHLDAASARAIGKAGFGLMCYTVNTAMRASQLFDWGVDAICTDRIDEIAADFAARV